MDMQLLTPIISWSITSLLGAIIGALFTQLRAKSAREKSLEQGMRVLMRAQLVEIHNHYVVEDKPCPVEVKEQATRVYEIYTNLGGNGTGTHLYREIMQTHVK